MERISILFDEHLAYKVASSVSTALELTLPEPLDESVWEKLSLIKELTYPLPIVVTFSPTWVETDLESILTRLASLFISGISIKKTFDIKVLSQINRAHNLGLALLQ